MSKEYRAPEYASQVTRVPVNWSDRDAITGRILEVLEAVLPEGKQLDATKNLIKEVTKQYWITLFNDQFDILRNAPSDNVREYREDYFRAIWEVDQREGMSDDPTPERSS